VDALHPREARNLLRALKASLRRIVERDPEQEVQGIALPVVDEVLRVARDVLPGHPVIARMEDIVSPEMIASGEPVRAVDALVVVDMLFEALKDAAR
jgi:hypothetical protein